MATILTCYYRPKPGGFCKRLFRAMEALLAAGHTVHYLAVQPFPIHLPKQPDVETDHRRCCFHRFPWPAEQTDTLLFWAVWHAFAPVLLAYIAVRHNITHALGFSPTYAALLKPVRWLKTIRLVCYLNGDLLFAHKIKSRPSWIVSLDRRIEGWAIHHTNVVSVSVSLLQTILHRHPAARPSSIRVLLNDMPAPVKYTLKSFQERLRLGFVGILEPTKNIVFLLRLMKLLPSEQFQLFIYGTGPLKFRLDRMVKQTALSDRVTFKGWVPSEKIWPELDLLLSPSLSEGLHDAVLEAIANYVPVLASDIPAHQEILLEEQLISLDHPCLWKDRLEKLVAQPEEGLETMRLRQLQSAKKFIFDWDAAVVEAIIGDS